MKISPSPAGAAIFFAFSPLYHPQTPPRIPNCFYTMKRKAEVAAEGKKPIKKRSKNCTATP